MFNSVQPKSSKKVSQSFTFRSSSNPQQLNTGFSGYLRRITEHQCKKVKVVYDQDRWIRKTLVGRILEVGDRKLKLICDRSQSILEIPVNQIDHVKLIDTFQVIRKWK